MGGDLGKTVPVKEQPVQMSRGSSGQECLEEDQEWAAAADPGEQRGERWEMGGLRDQGEMSWGSW